MQTAEKKERLRQEMAEWRQAVSPEERYATGAALCRVALAALAGETDVFVYASFGTEAPTWGIIAGLLERGIRVYLPKTGKNGAMEAVQWDGKRSLHRSGFGVLEPEGMPGAEPGCALVPGLAFDVAGGRLGYGGGFYDRWLAAHPGVARVGLCFAGQIIPHAPMDRHDFPMQRLLTERGMVLCRSFGSAVSEKPAGNF